MEPENTENTEDAAKDSSDRLDEVDISESPVTDEQSKGSSSEDHKSEDLFLNIAKDSEEQQVVYNETRKSRASLPFLSSSRLAIASSEERPQSSKQTRSDAHMLSPGTEVPLHYNKRLSLGYEGSDVEIGFNPTFLTDALRVVDSDEISLEMTAPNRPGLLKGGPNFLYVIMPVNLQ